MVITQTVDIPVDRRLTIEVPREIPFGKVKIVIQFPADENAATTALTAKNKPTPISDSLVGILPDAKNADIDQVRRERCAKHLQ